MPSFSPLIPQTASAHSQSQENVFRRILDHLRATAPDDPRRALLAQLSSLLPERLLFANPILRAQRDAIQAAINHHASNDDTIYTAASTALDSFHAVRVHGARCKTSAFFDRLCREMMWSRVAILAPSSVAEACFMALNQPCKQLTVIDVGPHFPGRTIAVNLATQTGCPTRYSVLSSAVQAMEGVDVLILGAREVCFNGNVICGNGAGALVQIAREAGVAVIVATQAVKISESSVIDWNVGGDVIRPGEITSILTEFDTASWKCHSIPDMLRNVVRKA